MTLLVGRLPFSGKSLALLLHNCPDNNGTDDVYVETCLHKAVRLQMWHNLKLLAKCEVDVNRQDAQGGTPLHKAHNCTHVNVWNTLITLGDNANIANNYCQTPFQKALRAKNTTAISVLPQYAR